MQQPRNKKNEPLVMLNTSIELTRADNTLVMSDIMLAEIASNDRSEGIVLGTIEGHLTFMVYDPTGKKTAYTLPVESLLHEIFSMHKAEWINITHERPITTADAELAKQDEQTEDDLHREPSKEELEAFAAIVPPSINEEA